MKNRMYWQHWLLLLLPHSHAPTYFWVFFCSPPPRHSNASRASGEVVDGDPTASGQPPDGDPNVPAYKIAMLGGSGVGKTTLTYQFTTSDYICAYDLSLGKWKFIIYPKCSRGLVLPLRISIAILNFVNCETKSISRRKINKFV